jgi:hypothetical protein
MPAINMSRRSRHQADGETVQMEKRSKDASTRSNNLQAISVNDLLQNRCLNYELHAAPTSLRVTAVYAQASP